VLILSWQKHPEPIDLRNDKSDRTEIAGSWRDFSSKADLGGWHFAPDYLPYLTVMPRVYLVQCMVDRRFSESRSANFS
jgi:hypothetical protein